MEVAEHIEALRLEGARATEAIRALPPDAAVPSCPDWTARDLIHHMGTVQRWATGYVVQARTEFRSTDFGEAARKLPKDAKLADWYEAGCATLLAALEAAPPDLQCWTFVPTSSPLAFWSRRQAHETAIHRADVELATGRPASGVTAFAPDFAADGIDELLTLFVPHRSGSLRADTSVSLGVRCSDDPGAWILTVGPQGLSVSVGAGAATCTMHGAASDLYLALWSRDRTTDRLDFDGDRTVLDVFCDANGTLNLSP